MFIIDTLKSLKKSLSGHQPLIEVFIYKQNLLHNLREYRVNYPNLHFAPVLKANAYGHGLEQTLKILKVSEDIPFAVVDSHFEARVAEKHAPNLQTLVIGYARLTSIAETSFNRSAFAIVSIDQLKEISFGLRSKKRFHLKIDTGMYRQGVPMAEIKEAVRLIANNPKIIIEGLCSHLADPENEAETLKQIANWNSVSGYLKKEFSGVKYTHLAATGGVKYSGKIDANLVRLGIGFYGIDGTSQNFLDLKPALEMSSIITGIKEVLPEEKIGYGFTFKAPNRLRLATVPAGYFEGVDRRLSNVGFMKIGQEFCPLVGRVSMDISTLDISRAGSVKLGDEVIIISANPKDKNSTANIARDCETLSHEILIHIPGHLKRIIV